MKLEIDDQIFSVLRNSGTSAYRVVDVIQVEKTV